MVMMVKDSNTRVQDLSVSFIQMSDDNLFVIPEMEPALRNQIQTCNMQIVNVTTPTNYFHVLHRQLEKEFRKPLIIMSPKNLLRHKDCKSNLSEFDDVQGHPSFVKQGTRFKRLNKDQNDNLDLEEGIRHLMLCSRKICSYSNADVTRTACLFLNGLIWVRFLSQKGSRILRTIRVKWVESHPNMPYMQKMSIETEISLI
ncbi:putative oxoglutarate dehydrogenase (succinyl-transferring) [Helianthus anomalus]